MNLFRAFLLVFVTPAVFALYAHPGHAAPSLQSDDPVQECAEEAKSSDPEDLGHCAMALGNLRYSAGNLRGALEAYQLALQVFQVSQNRKLEGGALVSLGNVYYQQGQYRKAIEYYHRALAIIQAADDQIIEGTVLNNLGNAYSAQGQNMQALEYFQQALTISRKVQDRTGEGIILSNVGLVYRILGQYVQALESYQAALAIHREVNDRVSEGVTLSYLGDIYTDQRQYTQALNWFQQALVIQQEVGDRLYEGETLNSIGGVYYEQGQYAQALDYLQQALVIRQEVGDRLGEGETLNLFGLVYRAQAQYAQALAYYQQSIAVFEELRAIAGNDAARTSFIGQYNLVYQDAVSMANKLDQDEQAFFISEQGRARSFLDALATGAVELSDQPAADLIAREQETYASWRDLQDALSQAKAQKQPDPALISDLETQLGDAGQEHTEALQAIEARGDELAALVPGRSSVLTLNELQSILDDQTTLVSYFVIGDDAGALAFIITENSFSIVELPNATPTNLITSVESLTAWPSLQDTHPQPLLDLYNSLIAPIKDQLKTSQVGIIPHLTLHYVPFAALTDGRTYLGEQYQLFELPSASSLRYVQQHAAEATNTGASVFGNPTTSETGLPSLPYAAAEADAVASVLGVGDYTGTAATELQLRQSVNGKAVLHLAVHGAYNQYNPLYSTLYLAPDPGNQYDGRLEVHEIFGLNLTGSQLVVLSACETQLGQLSTGDEVVGMTRAFMFAGTPSVLASLWKVDDEATQTLMSAFYRHWREDGMNKAQALQAAQSDVRANTRWQSPYYWAAFVLSGDVGVSSIQATTSPVTSNDTSTTNIDVIAGGGVLLLVCLCGSLGVVSLILFFGRRALRRR
jgi:CHAT domain-containing protein/Tfp pilus assembly protein PilF